MLQLAPKHPSVRSWLQIILHGFSAMRCSKVLGTIVFSLALLFSDIILRPVGPEASCRSHLADSHDRVKAVPVAWFLQGQSQLIWLGLA